MAQRVKGQSQLDYLWSNFGNLSVINPNKEGIIPTIEDIDQKLEVSNSQTVSKLKITSTKLIGLNSQNREITSVNISDLIKESNTLQGSETNSLVINVIDNVIEGKLKIFNSEDSLLTLKETDKGLQVLFKDSNLETKLNSFNQDLLEIKKDIQSNIEALQILNGDEIQEGSVLNLINNNIESAFTWQNI